MTEKIKVKQGNEILTSNSGIAIVGRLLNNTNIKERINNSNSVHFNHEKGIAHSDVIFSMAALISKGKPDYDAIESHRNDIFFEKALGIKTCPSTTTLRHRINLIGESANTIIKEESAIMIKNYSSSISPISTSCGEYIPLDIDVSPFNNEKTSKEGVSRTYKGYDGYAPINAFIGAEGYMVNVELREGKQHCQKNTPEFILETIGYARQITDNPILIRMDSGNDSKDNFPMMDHPGIEFIIKRNLRRESLDAWADLAKANGEELPCRDGKQIWIGKTEVDIKGNALPFPIVFEVTERTVKKGQYLAFPEIEVCTYWCTIKDLPPSEVIELYHDHGTSEQFHSEIKTDMNLERFPSGRFSSNSMILVLGMLVFNILRLIGQQSIVGAVHGDEKLQKIYRKKVFRRRLLTVMQDLIYLAGRLIRTGRRYYISFGCVSPFGSLWDRIYSHFSKKPAPG